MQPPKDRKSPSKLGTDRSVSAGPSNNTGQSDQTKCLIFTKAINQAVSTMLPASKNSQSPIVTAPALGLSSILNQPSPTVRSNLPHPLISRKSSSSLMSNSSSSPSSTSRPITRTAPSPIFRSTLLKINPSVIKDSRVTSPVTGNPPSASGVTLSDSALRSTRVTASRVMANSKSANQTPIQATPVTSNPSVNYRVNSNSVQVTANSTLINRANYCQAAPSLNIRPVSHADQNIKSANVNSGPVINKTKDSSNKSSVRATTSDAKGKRVATVSKKIGDQPGSQHDKSSLANKQSIKIGKESSDSLKKKTLNGKSVTGHAITLNPSSSRQNNKASLKDYFISGPVSELLIGQPLKPLGERCQLCRIDIGFTPCGSHDSETANNPPVCAVLPCGHSFHAACLDSVCGNVQPDCISCAASSRKQG